MTGHPGYGTVRRLSDRVAVLTEGNPGPMTLDGTNSYLLGAPGSGQVVVVDPGEDDAEHLGALAAAGAVVLTLITHRHADHTGGAAAFAALTGAPVRAADPSFCHRGDPLADGEVIAAAGLRIEVVASPGHTDDSVSFHLPEDGSVLTGDTILGRGTTVITHPDGSVGDYLATLDRLEALGPLRVLPAHGAVLPDLIEVVRAYRNHRQERLAQVRAALATVGADADLEVVLDAVYTDIDPAVRFAARQSLQAQLDHLRG